MKARAPPPPPQAPQPAPRHIFRNTVPDGGGTSGMEAKENMLRPSVDIQLTLPQGYQTFVTEDGSKALMDLLVELCSRYHLNPALHTLELLSPEGHTLGFKPNVLLGSLNVACVFIKEKVWEEKVVRRPAPKVPEKTVRLMVNYHGSQKAVVRVNPLVPLQALIPVICEKCEFDPAHVLLLKDSVSRHELPLDRSLTELGIKELYVHDQSLDSISSSTTSLGKAEKKGLLGIFQFSRRKNKTETTSLDMDDYDDKVFQNTDSQSNGLSSASGVLDERPSTLGQSQSVATLPRMSPKAETKKRRAPALPGAPTPIMRNTSFESYQMGPGSESQQRKRKAPAPPPTPASITPGPEDTSPSHAPTPDSPAIETPTPVFHTKVVQSTTISASTVVTQTVKPAPPKTAEPPLPVHSTTPTPSSPTPSSSTTDSMAIQDSSSELSHSLDDSDPDLDQASTLTSSTASGSQRVQPAAKVTSIKMEESEKICSVKMSQDVSSASSSRSETESALNLKLDEAENQRHSAIGSFDRPVPPKPRRYPAQESPQISPPTTPSPPPSQSNPRESPVEEAAPQSWLHSMQSAIASSQKAETQEEETMSLGSSSSGSSLPDQGYAEGMAEGEDSGIISSPSDTQPTSPDGSLSLDGSSRGRGERLLGPVRDNSSDSDEGCATWGSRHRHNDISQKERTGKLEDSYEDDQDVTAQLHQTLADLEADLAAHTHIPAVEKVSYSISTDGNEVPVSVVDMDVPVTAIDEVLEDFEHNIVENTTKSRARTESKGTKGPGFCHQSSAEPENKNNNACTAADSNNSSSAETKQLSEPKEHRKSQEKKSRGDKMVKKMSEIRIEETSITDTNKVKNDKQKTSAVKSEADTRQRNKNTEIKPDPVITSTQSFHGDKPVVLPTTQRSANREEEMQRVYQNNSSSSASYGKITRSVTSRFGMNTFTVVPPKPPVIQAAEEPASRLTAGAIKIDDQGNMVKSDTIIRNKFGGSSESAINGSERSPLLGKAKAFWSLNERQENAVSNNKSVIEKAKESTDGLKSLPLASRETTVKILNTEDIKTTQFSFQKLSEQVQPKEANEPVSDIKISREERAEVESKISMSKVIQQPSSKPVLPPPILPNLKKDLSFLKTSRRTSSQYVASAINKYTPKNPVTPSFIPDSSTSIKTQTSGFHGSGRSIHVNPQLSSQSSFSENKENDSALKFNFPAPKRSISYPEYVSDSQRDFGELKLDKEGFGSSFGSTKGVSITLQTETTKNTLLQSSGPTQIKATAYNGRDDTTHNRQRSPSPALRSPVQPSAKPPTAPKIVFKDLTHDTKDTMKITNHLTHDVRPQPSETVTDSAVAPEPSPVTLFGPVKKFKPVICRSVEKETSLHSSLMEAIQTGGGRERLKKITTSGPSNIKKASYVEEENERSALLAAIRAQSITGRLRKTKSEAACELEKFRKASEDKSSAGSPSSPSPPSLTCTSPPVFTPPPPPPAPLLAPPPPPPVFSKGRPSNVTNPSANALVDPALAREAMLEAIRSGSAAERLKKVTVPTKTLKVNGRLGTIQATSSTLPPQ